VLYTFANWIIGFLDSVLRSQNKKRKGLDSVVCKRAEEKKMADDPKPTKKIPIHVQVSDFIDSSAN
jgi:hypothetical protein